MARLWDYLTGRSALGLGLGPQANGAGDPGEAAHVGLETNAEPVERR
jgi:hypothetical protein